MTERTSPLIRFVTPGPNTPLLKQVIALGDSQSKTLGLLPYSAWRDYALKQRVLVAVAARSEESAPDPVLGYAAFRLPRQEVVLTHLVVNPRHRGHGVARALVRELTARYSSRSGIAARCRRDYPADKMWPKLGFVSRGDRPGRSAAGHPLTMWWYDHGHPDLIAWQGASPAVLAVVIDANVFIDLHGKGASPTAKETRGVLQGLNDRVEVLVSPETSTELNRLQDPLERSRLIQLAQSYPRLAVPGTEVERIQKAITAELGRAPTRTQDVSDLRQVAYASAAGVPVVVTRDRRSRNRLDAIAIDLAGVALTSPSELVTLVDESENEPAYAPEALLRTAYQRTEAGPDDRAHLKEFLANASGETRASFDLVNEALSRSRPSSHRFVISDPEGRPVALVGTLPTEGALNVTLARLQPCALQATLAAQITSQLRVLAAEAGVAVIRVTDNHLHPLIYEALLADGYRTRESHLVGFTLRQLTTITEITTSSKMLLTVPNEADRDQFLQLMPSSLRDEVTPEACLQLEHQLRPLRILDAPLETWLVPIKPNFAADLFGHPEHLFDRPSNLGMSLEHVYYRGGRSGEVAPGRLLWYVSGPRHGYVIGCSSLTGVVDGSPKDLFRRFRRLGVWSFQQVEAAASRGQVRALSVMDTEILVHPVSLERLRDLAQGHRQRLQLVSAARIGDALFADVMREGRHGR